jgi:hypothetical protein
LLGSSQFSGKWIAPSWRSTKGSINDKEVIFLQSTWRPCAFWCFLSVCKILLPTVIATRGVSCREIKSSTLAPKKEIR